MVIDWAGTGAMISGWGSWASAAAVAYAAWKAANTFESWKLRRVTEREEEIAQRALVATFRVKEAFQWIRSPLKHSVELSTAEDALKANPKWDDLTLLQKHKHASGQVYIDRIVSFGDRFQALEECIPYARAVFGHELGEAMHELHRQLWIFRTTVEAFVANDTGDREITRSIMIELNDHQLSGAGRITISIKASIATIEAICLPVLRP